MGHYDRILEILSKNVDAFLHSKYWLFQIHISELLFNTIYIFCFSKNGMRLNQIFDNLNGMNA